MLNLRNLGLSLSCLLIAAIPLTGQTLLKGSVRDAATGRPVENVNIKVGGNPVTSTSKEGRFAIEVAAPVSLTFSHVSYRNRDILLNSIPKDSLKIELVPNTQQIGEVVITGKPYFQYFKPETFYIQDYAIRKNQVWALGFRNKNVLKPELRVLSMDGKTIDRISIPQNSGIYQDPTGTVHLFTEDSIKQLNLYRGNIVFEYAFPMNEAAITLFNMQVISGDSVIFRAFNNSRSFCEFILADVASGSRDTIFASYDRELFDSEKAAVNYLPGAAPTIVVYPSMVNKVPKTIDELKNENPMYQTMSPKDIRFTEGISTISRRGPDRGNELTRQSVANYAMYAMMRLIVHKPVEATMVRRNDRYFVFESTNRLLWSLFPNFSIEKNLFLTLSKDARRMEMLQDPMDQSLYITYQVNGSQFVAKLDPETGSIVMTKRIEGFPFPEKIMVYGGRIYFIYDSPTGQNFTNLFSISFF